ncbi:uncharacterized protein [Primulina eburnea]|uniref:uncharacterized protein n=1 Tax=Primulina eburnea TaxID=1245227 RepID=UPI003C6C55E3
MYFWEKLSLWNLVLSCANEAEGFVQWFFQIISNTPEPVIDKITMVLWRIWRARNDMLWNRNSQSATQVIEPALKFLSDWRGVRSNGNSSDSRHETTSQTLNWQKPQAPALKCNIDATIQYDLRTTGMGMALQDSTGSFISARTNAFLGLVGIKEAEARHSRRRLVGLKAWDSKKSSLNQIPN